MDRSKDLFKNTTIIFIGTFCTSLISYFLLPLYTNVLNTSQYGILELLTTLISLVVPIIIFHIDQGVFRYLIKCREKREKENEKKYISTSIFFTLLMSIIFIIIYIPVLLFIKFDYKIYLLLNIIVSSLLTVILQISRGLGKNKEYSFISFLAASTTIVFNVLFLTAFSLKLEGMLLASILGNLISFILMFFLLKLYKYISIKNVNKKSLKEMIGYSAPLIPSEISWWIFSVSDRYVVMWFISSSATGILSIVYKFSNIVIMFYNIFNISLTENIALHINDKDIKGYFNNIFNNITKLFASFSILILIYMPIIFELAINKSYIEAYKYTPIASIASILQVMVGTLGTIYAANNNTKSLAKTAIVSAIINIIVDLLLVQFIGIYAAVVSTIASYFVLLLYRYLDIRKNYFKVKFSLKNILIILLLIMGTSIIYYSNNILLKYISMPITTIFMFIYNKETILFVKNLIINKVKGGKNE